MSTRSSYLYASEAYLAELTGPKAFLYSASIIYVVVISALSILQPFFFDICKEEHEALDLDFENPAYDQRICTRTRSVALLFLTPEECSFGRRFLIAAVLGGLIGWERRSADRPAGIRLMSLVSLGSCLFSVCSVFAFIQGPMNWDGSRVAAAIPSGVGFLGAGIIWKQVNKETNGQTVHGLTTAASAWLSAAVGIACSGELYFAATFCVAIMLVLLRFGPIFFDPIEEYDENNIEAGFGTHHSTTRSFSLRNLDTDEVTVLTNNFGGNEISQRKNNQPRDGADVQARPRSLQSPTSPGFRAVLNPFCSCLPDRSHET